MMSIKRRFLLVSIVSVVCLLFFVSLWTDDLLRMPILRLANNMDIACYQEYSTKDSLPKFDHYKEKPRLSSGKNIFFHETSCFSGDGAELNSRQACAVESAARMNPGWSVNLLFLSPSPPSARTRQLVDHLLEYPNVRVYRVLIADYIKDTPVEEWYASGMLSSSYWPRSHMSDVMRYLTLWKYGGIYMDLDVVVTTSLDGMGDFAGAEDWTDVAAGFIGFSTSSVGRKFADACLRDLVKNFRGNIWGNNGPGVITRTLKKFCKVEHAKDMTPGRCQGFQVFPPSAFYPIFYKEWRQYFETKNFNKTMSLITKARAIHVWNKMSSSMPVQVGSKVPYAVTAEKFCPAVYGNCTTVF